MTSKKLKIGRIPYANFFPIFYYLDRKCDTSDYSFVKGVPSKLNKMLRNDELDISPSSSIEFLRHRKKYFILPWFSISSAGPINSILLFSRFPLEQLGGKTIALSSDSETSVALLKVILREFLSLKCRFRTTDRRSVRNILSEHSAVLHIGDTAMIEARKLKAADSRTEELFVYDLGELWEKYTGLPFVYALWIVRKKALVGKIELVKKLAGDLISAKKYANGNLLKMAAEAPQNKWISNKELVTYWKIISYDFTEKHMEGLRLFEQYVLNK